MKKNQCLPAVLAIFLSPLPHVNLGCNKSPLWSKAYMQCTPAILKLALHFRCSSFHFQLQEMFWVFTCATYHTVPLHKEKTAPQYSPLERMSKHKGANDGHLLKLCKARKRSPTLKYFSESWHALTSSANASWMLSTRWLRICLG